MCFVAFVKLEYQCDILNDNCVLVLDDFEHFSRLSDVAHARHHLHSVALEDCPCLDEVARMDFADFGLEEIGAFHFH